MTNIQRKPVIIIIDMLNDCFVHKELHECRASLCDKINQLTRWARTNNFPVIWVRQEFAEDLCDAFLDMKKENIKMFIKDTPGSQILDELIQKHGDLEIIKKRYSAFHNTNLKNVLNNLGSTDLILAGVNTHACIRMAAIDGYQNDFEVTLLREGVASKDRQHHEVTMKYLDGGIAKIQSLEEILSEFTPQGTA